MVFARRIFLIAGIYGLLTLTSLYFMEGRIGQLEPPAITHPEYFYGFTGMALAWQLGFLWIARDPVRYRPFMLIAVLEKASFGIPVAALFAAGRVSGQVLTPGLIDLALGALFLVAYSRTAELSRRAAEPAAPEDGPRGF